MQNDKYDQTVEQLKELLAKVHTAWVDVLLKLRSVEEDGVWKLGGYAHFQDFLRAEFPNAIGLERYTNGIRAIELYGEELVRQVGVQSAHAMCVNAIAQDDAKRQLVADSIREHIVEHGVAPDVNRIKTIVRGIAPETVRPARETRRLLESDILRIENEELRKKNKKLERENTVLRKRLDKIQQGAASKRQSRPQPTIDA